MSQQAESSKSITAGEALVAWRRVKLSGSTVVYADEGDRGIGVVQVGVASGEEAAIRLDNAGGTSKMMASGAITAGAKVYPDDDGKISALGTDPSPGYTLETSTADGDVIEVLMVRTPRSTVEIYAELLSGGSYQEISEVSTTQNYPIGARRVDHADGTEHYYALAGGTLNPDLGCKTQNTQAVAYTTVAVAALAQATQVTIDVGGSDGIAADGVIAVNALVNGYVVFFPHDENSFTRRITANTVTAGAGEMTLTLADPIPVALTVDTDHGECMASPYADVRALTNTTTTVVGQPECAAVANEYVWLKKIGVTWLAPQGAVSVGNNNRQFVFRHDGSIDEIDNTDANVDRAQRGGYVLANASGGGQGAPFVKLQI